ncbi:MAG: glycosyltransferase family 39 protein [bacterium]|nr:glycosyltransferase family 39 protein [bacterium]
MDAPTQNSRWWPLWIGLLCLGLLAPFSAKAVHVDDPLFLRTAQRIAEAPGDFFGFEINWFGVPQPMSEVMSNPPGFAYFLAGWGSVFGWSEAALHWGAFLWAAVAAVGVHRLARHLCPRAEEAALIAVCSPVFLLTATTLMCDTMMLACWTWAIALWVEGLQQHRPKRLVGAALLIVLGALTKYFAISLIPLLLAYTLIQREASRRWALLLAVPVTALVGYELLTQELYGSGMLAQATANAGAGRDATSIALPVRALVGLSFTGGCVVALVAYAPLLWRRWRAAGMVAAALLIVLGGLILAGDGALALRDEDGTRWGLVVQAVCFVLGGLALVLLALTDLWRRRDAASILLALWVFGTLFFAVFLYQFVAARTLIPLAPAAGILVARRGADVPPAFPSIPWLRLLPVAISLLIAVAVTWADFNWAAGAREAAREIAEAAPSDGGRLCFMGHWGFQHYMEQGGAVALDQSRASIGSHDLLVVPTNNANTRLPDRRVIASARTIRRTPSIGVATMQQELGAGFYSSVWGPAPYVFGVVPDDLYHVIAVRAP